MRNPLQTLNFTAGAAVAAYRIVKHGASDSAIIQGAAATDKLIGIGPEIATASGEPCDVHTVGAAEVEYGGTVARGDMLTSDANGKAIATTTAANRVIGTALVSGSSADIGSCMIDRQLI